MEAINESVDSSVTKQEDRDNVSFNKLEIGYSYIFLILGFCFVHFVIFHTTGIFTTLFFWIIPCTCFFYLRKSNYTLTKGNKLQFALILIFSTVFFVTANNFIKFLNVIFLLLMGVYWVYSVCKGNRLVERFFFFDMQKAIFKKPFAKMGMMLKVLSYSTGKSKIGNNIKLILVGIILTVPITMVIVLLLINADSGTEQILNALFGNLSDEGIRLLIQFILGIPVAFYLFGMLYSNVNRKSDNTLENDENEKKLEKIKISPNIVMYSAVTPICLLYLIFFISQIQYFISAFLGILPELYSYAQYARRGFFELFAISIINLMILVIINFFSKQTGEKKPVTLKIYSIVLSVFTILIITTALSKMILYIMNYGLTQLRVYTSWFMVLLAIIFIYIIIKQLNYKFCLEKYAVITFILFFGGLCFSNVDGNIARYNITMYQEGYLNDLDVYALSNLSDDALVYVLEQKLDTKNYLEGKLEAYHNNPYLVYNLSSFRVKRLLEKK